MGRWVKTNGFKLKPHRCIACGGSTPNDVAFFCEAVDVNWGDSVYLCASCVRVLGELAGMIEPEEAEDLKLKNTTLETQVEETLEGRDKLQGRIDRMLDGKAAVKEARAERPKRKVKASA